MWICLDNLEVTLRLLYPSLTTSQSVFSSFMKAREAWKHRDCVIPGGDIHIRWVPGHANVRENELADAEARKGSSRLPVSPFPLSFASLKKWQANKVREARSKWWESESHKRYRTLSIDTAPIPPKELQLPRHLLGRLIAARSGHGDFADYHDRFGHLEAELRCACNARKSPLHFFFCRIARRRARRPQGAPSTLIPWLIGTDKGISTLTEWWRKNRFYEDICLYR